MKNLQILKDFPYDPIGSFRTANPYGIYFCYTNPKYKPSLGNGEFIVKGGLNVINHYLARMHIPMIVFPTFWRHGRSRSLTPQFVNFEFHNYQTLKPYFSPTNWTKMHGRCFYRHHKLTYNKEVIAIFRKVPRKWIPEYDKFVGNCNFKSNNSMGDV